MILTIDWSDYGTPAERHIEVADAIEKAKEKCEGSFSMLMFFEHRKPLRIRSNKPATIGTGDRTLEAIDLWCEDGRGNMIIKTSSRHHMNDIYPSKSLREVSRYGEETVEEIYFHYYTGNYGNHRLWGAVANARNHGGIIGDAVADYFKRYSLEYITEDIKYDDENGETIYRDFEYSVYDSRGECILQVGRNAEDGEYEHLTPSGINFIGGYEYEE